MSARSARRGSEPDISETQAAYFIVVKDLENPLTSREQLRDALQQTGRNPTQKVLNKFWPASTKKLTYEDFSYVCSQIPVTTEKDLIAAFKKIDINGDNYISADELFKNLCSRGEKMTRAEVQDIIDEVDANKDGKLDYKEFCNMMQSTQRELMRAARQQMKSQQQDKSSNRSKPPVHLNKNDSTIPSKIAVQTFAPASSTKMNVDEPRLLNKWHHAMSRGAFFFEEDGDLVSHQYKIQLDKASDVWITIEPALLRSRKDYNSQRPQSAVTDTAIFVVRDKPDRNGDTLVAFTEDRNSKGKYCLQCHLDRGTYHLLPFTTGCRFRRRKTEPKGDTKLLKETEPDVFILTKPFKEALTDIFEMCDLNMNGLLSREEFNWFNVRTSGEEVADDEWQVVEENVKLEKGQLTLQGFLELNEMEAEDNKGDTADLWVTLHCMGYNKALVMDEACPFLLNVHSESCEVDLSVSSVDTLENKLDQAIYEATTTKGEISKIRGTKDVYLHSYMTVLRSTILVENKSRSRITLSLDCSKSINCDTHRESLDISVEVPSKATMVVHHLMSEDDRKEWTVDCVDHIIR